jgi:hypothetical protein
MNCQLCLDDAPLHAKYSEGGWMLACRVCDFRDEDWFGDTQDVLGPLMSHETDIVIEAEHSGRTGFCEFQN